MQFNVAALIAVMASVAAAETVTVYACPSSTIATAGVASSTGTIASTGVATAATSTGSPIAYATGAASMNVPAAMGAMIVAGGVALFL